MLDHCSLSQRSSSSVYSAILSRGSISDSWYLLIVQAARALCNVPAWFWYGAFLYLSVAEHHKQQPRVSEAMTVCRVLTLNGVLEGDLRRSRSRTTHHRSRSTNTTTTTWFRLSATIRWKTPSVGRRTAVGRQPLCGSWGSSRIPGTRPTIHHRWSRPATSHQSCSCWNTRSLGV